MPGLCSTSFCAYILQLSHNFDFSPLYLLITSVKESCPCNVMQVLPCIVSPNKALNSIDIHISSPH